MNRLKRIHNELLNAIEENIKKFSSLQDLEQKRIVAETIQLLSGSHREIIESMDLYTEALYNDTDNDYFEGEDNGKIKQKRKKIKNNDEDIPF